MRTLGSAHRLNAVRGPRASGHPPWEPAEKPVSELPWMDAPGSAQSRMVPPRRVFPVGAEGQAAGSAGGLGAGETGAGGLALAETGSTGRADRRWDRPDRHDGAGPAAPEPVHDRLRAGPAPSQEPEPVPRPGRPARRGWRVRPLTRGRRGCRGRRGRCTPGTRPTPRRPSPRSRRRETRGRASRSAGPAPGPSRRRPSQRRMPRRSVPPCGPTRRRARTPGRTGPGWPG